MKLRITGFGLAILLMAVLIAWATHSSLRRVAGLREKLTSQEIVSFQAGEHFRASLRELDNRLLTYQARSDLADRDKFLSEWSQLNDWIDVQKPTLTTRKEKDVLDQIDGADDDYLAAATNLMQLIDRKSPPKTIAAGKAKADEESGRLLNFAYQLADAHEQALNQFLDISQRSLRYLRGVIFVSLFLLLALGAWLAGVVYRDMINPLRLKLVESRAIIERQEKLASLGVLAAGVAHEIRNPLTAIKARLFTQQKLLKSGSPELVDARIIGDEINRLEHIVKDVLQFARPTDPKLVVIPAAAALREIRDLLAPQLEKESIHLKLAATNGAMVQADSQQLKQVLINLVQNAAESIGKDGEITLRARTDTARLGGQPVPVVILEVEDTGRGISPEVQKRLFDPFFSTKEGGTGLGLSIAARIVEKHGGALEFQTQVNHGTTFGIVLPRVEKA